MPGDRNRFTLSDAENENIFRRDIVPEIFSRVEGSSENPTVVFIGGQPGAGKSSSLKQAERELSQKGPTIVIEGDSYRPYHPQYAMLQVTEPLNSAFYTGGDAGKWTEKVIAEARERGLNIILETTFRQPDVVARTMAEFREAGYEIDARALAVSERQSWQNVHTRFESMIAEGQQARFTLREAHDAAATGMVVTLGEIERQNLADRVSIYKFGGDRIYENKLVNGTWERAPEAANVVGQERQRPLAAEESERFHQGWQNVIEAMEKRRARPAELEKVKMLAVADQQWTAAIERQQQERNYLVEPQKVPDLTEAEITARVAGSSQVEKARSQVEVKARLVYGDVNAGERFLQDANRNPVVAEAIGSRLRADASQFGELAGRAGGMFRSASPDRISAEAETLPLARAVEDYGLALQNERQKVLDTHKQEQQRAARGIEEPSPQLRQALGAPEQERLQRLTSPGLVDELRRFNQQVDARLSQTDRAAIHQGNYAQLGKSLGVSQERAQQIGRLHQQSTAAARTQQQARQITQTKGPVLQR